MQIQMRGRLHVNYFQPHRKATEVATKRLKTSLKKEMFRFSDRERVSLSLAKYLAIAIPFIQHAIQIQNKAGKH